MGNKLTVHKNKAKIGNMPEATGLNYFHTDSNLSFLLNMYLREEEFAKVMPLLAELGEVAGEELDELSREADRNPPELVSFNKRGQITNEVKYHSSYKRMEEIGYSKFGLVAMSHRAGVMGWPNPFSRVEKYSFWYLFAQSEFGLCCPMSMTDAAASIIEKFGNDDLKEKYLPNLLSTDTDNYWTAAQFMTEKQGGSDVGLNNVEAKQVGDHWQIWGDKWFCSNVSADVALVLARPENAQSGTRGLAMFLVPKRLENGEHNRFKINRLKDKFGTRDMATGEVTFEGAIGYAVGDIENGFKQMMSMVNSSRLSNSVRSAALMRRSYLEVLQTTRGRVAFGKPLIELPLMKESVFEILLDTEAAASAIFYTAKVFDDSENGSERSKVLLRILTPILKGYICKRARYTTTEAMEIRGGNGYIEDWVDSKLVRDAQVGSIWEGTTNIVALDVIRAIKKNKAGEVFFDDIERRILNLQNSHVNKVANIFMAIKNKVEGNVYQLIYENEDVDYSIYAKKMLNQMYHLLVVSLLLEESEYQLSNKQGYRKLFLSLQYIHEYLVFPEMKTSAFEKSRLEWLESIIDWEHLPEAAIERLLKNVL
ncbi:acyl-CoA dehydrogenase family protein [Oceanobacillus senegalensis]|uniref:acyl-CoA dehydrogenase family protein n=1 Tax=Oceanobacillus senegalensis TaxID=1936063 RepID=UPI000A30587E|nr:acyl-CoA dehydrogenase family protein [Oceanobacillus senegalensis]